MRFSLLRLSLLLGALFLSNQLPSRDALASPTTLSFAKTEKILPRGTTVSVSSIDLQTGVIVQNFETKPRARVTTNCDTRFCIAAARATAVVRSGRKRSVQQYLGISKGFGSEVNLAANRVIRLSKRSTRTRMAGRTSAAAVVTRAAGQIRIGVPGSGITINKELSNLIGSPTNLASTIITTLTLSPCYRGDGSYSVVEVDPRILAERKKEFDLIKKGYVKADPNFRDSYTPPDHSVRANVSQTGSSATASVQITNAAGQVIASATGTTSSGGWFDALNRAALDLASQLCEGPKVNIALAQCFLRECSCGGDSTGYRIDLRVEGIAKLPLNGLMYATIPVDDAVTHNCGGATASSFGGAMSCRRSSTAEPESFEYNFASLDPKAPSCSCPRDGAPQSLLFIATAIDLATGEREDAIVEDVPCVVTR